MTERQLKALMAATLFPLACKWTENSAVTPERKAIELAQGILDEIGPDVGDGQ